MNTLVEKGEKRDLDARAVADLREFQRVLQVARQNNVGWHLAVAFSIGHRDWSPYDPLLFHQLSPHSDCYQPINQ